MEDKPLTLNDLKRIAKKAERQAEQKRKNVKPYAVLCLLKRYRRTRANINAIEQTTDHIMRRYRYEQYFFSEESLKNQKVQAAARQTDMSVELMERLETALETFKEDCERSIEPQTRFQYAILYDRYLSPEQQPIREISMRYQLDQKELQEAMKLAIRRISSLLFGDTSEGEMEKILAVIEEYEKEEKRGNKG